MDYTDAQKAAIAHSGSNLQIIACAGSGKTQVLAARVVEVLHNGAAPNNVVAFTFTDKAAAELKDRINRLAEERIGRLTGLAEMFVGTIHGYCLHILQTYLFRYLKYSVLSEVQTRLLVSRNSRRSGLQDVTIITGPSSGKPLKRNPQDVRVFLDAINVLREDEVDWGSIPSSLGEALTMYTALLDDHRYLDYSRIMSDALKAMRDDGVEGKRLQTTIAQRVKYLIVDEYQDMNPLQEAIIRCIYDLGATLCVVGDDDQTIYQWRGSEIRNILDFAERYPSVHSETLADNFRSSEGIVRTGRHIAEINNPDRLEKAMEAKSHQMFERGDILALTFADPLTEARWIAKRILELRGRPFVDDPGKEPRGLTFSDCAVLMRSVSHNGAVITQALDEAGIPHVVGGLASLFERAAIKAAVAIFQYMIRKNDEAELRRAWLNANLGLSDTDLSAGIVVLNEARTWQPGERWGAYNIQRTYLRFLEAVQLREERVPPTTARAPRGEVVFYNLGKFSQVITDFETIHFKSAPQRKYETFSWWLLNEASFYYEEGGENVGFAQPDAVQIMTIHQAKGMEWPAVFVPALIRNRFPSSSGVRGRSKWHILPQDAIRDAKRYDGSGADERRLFYVAITRSKKYLYCSYAPIAQNRLFRHPSMFMQEVTGSPYVLTRETPLTNVQRLDSRAKHEVANVVFSFSELKYLFECAYQFKLRFMYGFNPPLHEALGYGKSLHDALAEVHKRALDGQFLTDADAETLMDEHLHVPYAPPDLAAQLRSAGIAAIRRYLAQQGRALAQTMHSEQQVEIQVTPGITVNGRIDLIKRLDTKEVSIVDFKSTERAQEEDVTRKQLHSYAIGYQQLSGVNANVVEIHNLDEQGRNVRELVDDEMLRGTKDVIREAGDNLRAGTLPRLERWCQTCDQCDLLGICQSRPV